MTKYSITVFTPTFNRGYLLPRLYDSLCSQTNKDFCWLIVDDGSNDNTMQLVEQWKRDGKVTIFYHFKENGGMHTAHNFAYENIDTELNVCIDSDDRLLENSIDIILKFWTENKDFKYAGILGLDIYENGRIVSNRCFPEDVKSGKYSHLKGKYGLKGDIKFVYRTSIIKRYPEYPVFENETFTPLGYKYLLIDQDYDMLFLNEPLCIVEYIDDGSTRNIIKQYFKNPNGFIAERKIRMQFAFTFKERFVNAMHYVSSCLILKKKRIISDSPRKALTFFAYPFGVILNRYLRSKL